MNEIFCPFCGHVAETNTTGVIVCHNPSCLWNNSNNMNKNKILCIDNKIKELRAENKDLHKNIEEKSAAIHKNVNDISKLKIERERLIYGQPASCECCRYNVVLTFSEDGEHNRCGNIDAPCTCCHYSCEHFRPDNEITVYMKAHSRCQISPETKHAFDVLFGRDIWESDNCKSDKKEALKKFLEFYFKELNWWRD